MSSLQLTPLERNFIHHFQGGFPLQSHPFRTIAEQLNSTEQEIISVINKLKQNRILTRFGPLYDAARLGGGLTLAAMSVPEENFDRIAEQVNHYPEVAHNYKRNHELNMWFVLATETPGEIVQVISSIETATGLTVYNFPKQQEFYIGLWFDLSSTGSFDTVPVPEQSIHSFYELNSLDRQIIQHTQTGLPVTAQPYRSIAEKIGCSEDDIITQLEKMLGCGMVRRIGAVPNHYKLGFKANGMTVWDVDDEHISELGRQIGQLDFVSHSYQRPRHLPVWPYNLFAMVHGQSPASVSDKVDRIKDILGDKCRAKDILFSSAILKKTGLRLAA